MDTLLKDESLLELAKTLMQQTLIDQAKEENHPYVLGHPNSPMGRIFASNLPTIAKSRMNRLHASLGALDFSKSIDFLGFRERSSKTAFLFSNETNMGEALDFFSLCPFQKLPEDTIRVAMLVGESNFLSLLPTLVRHAQHVLIVDIDPLVLAHNQFMLQCLLDSHDPLHFQELYFNKEKNPALKANLHAGSVSFFDGAERKHQASDLKYDEALLARFLKDKITTFGNKYFYANEERFFGVQTTAKNTQFTFLQLDLFDSVQVSALKKVLDDNNAQITACNLTNLFFHDNDQPCRSDLGTWQPKGRFEANMKLLMNENAPIPTLFSIYSQGVTLLLKNLQAPCLMSAFSRSQQNLLIINISAIGTKYGFKDEKLNVNEIFRMVAAKGTTIELNYLFLYRELFKLLKKDPDIAKNLVAAARRGINLEIDINGTGNKSGRTALHFAVVHNMTDNVALLFSLPDIRLDIKDKVERKTARDYAKGEMKVLFDTKKSFGAK